MSLAHETNAAPTAPRMGYCDGEGCTAIVPRAEIRGVRTRSGGVIPLCPACFEAARVRLDLVQCDSCKCCIPLRQAIIGRADEVSCPFCAPRRVAERRMRHAA